MDQHRSFTHEFELEHDQDIVDDDEQNLEEEAEAMLKAWDKDQFEKEVQQEKELNKRNEDNKDMDVYDGEKGFDEIAKEMTMLESKKVHIKILEANPDGPRINANTTVLFDTVSYLEFEPSPFASSFNDGKPCKINLSVGPIIPGLVQALIEMREGERANILIHPHMAYGPLGCPPVIPPESTILCQVKVYKIWANSTLDHLLKEERDERFEASSDVIIKLVEEHKDLANKLLNDNQIKDAAIQYKMALRRLFEIPNFPIGCVGGKELLLALLQNCANALNTLGYHASASNYAKRALQFDPESLKAYYQLIKAKISLGDADGAQQQLQKVDKISPNNSCFTTLRVQVDQLCTAMKHKRDEIERKMAKGIVSGL